MAAHIDEAVFRESKQIERITEPGDFLAHLSLWLKGELIVYICSGVRRCRRSPFSKMNISEASWPIAIKFYLKHHWGGGKAAWGFGKDQFQNSGFHGNR